MTAASCTERYFYTHAPPPYPLKNCNIVLYSKIFVLHCILFAPFCVLSHTLFQVSTDFVKFWLTFAAFGTLSQVLTHFLKFWHTFSGFDILFQALTHFSSFNTIYHALLHFIMLCYTFWSTLSRFPTLSQDLTLSYFFQLSNKHSHFLIL